MIILIEGPRNSGKTHLIRSLSRKTFKFPFDFWYDNLKMPNDSSEIHSFALSKEIILHQLNKEGFIKGPVIVDRGILTTLVWGILQKRISEFEAIKQLKLWISQDLFKDTEIIIVNGNKTTDERQKDFWDKTNIIEEKRIFNLIVEEAVNRGVNITQIVNSFDEFSIKNFGDTIKVCAES